MLFILPMTEITASSLAAGSAGRSEKRMNGPLLVPDRKYKNGIDDSRLRRSVYIVLGCCRGCSGDGALTCWIFLKKALCNRSLRPLLGVLAVKAFLGDRPRSEPKKASDWVGIDQ